MQPFIEARIKFADADGMKQRWPLYPPYVGLILKIGESFHDCRVIVGEPIHAGEERVLKIQFLRPDLVMPKLTIGTNFKLQTSEIIAEAVVVKIIEKDS